MHEGFYFTGNDLGPHRLGRRAGEKSSVPLTRKGFKVNGSGCMYGRFSAKSLDVDMDPEYRCF